MTEAALEDLAAYLLNAQAEVGAGLQSVLESTDFGQAVHGVSSDAKSKLTIPTDLSTPMKTFLTNAGTLVQLMGVPLLLCTGFGAPVLLAGLAGGATMEAAFTNKVAQSWQILLRGGSAAKQSLRRRGKGTVTNDVPAAPKLVPLVDRWRDLRQAPVSLLREWEESQLLEDIISECSKMQREEAQAAAAVKSSGLTTDPKSSRCHEASLAESLIATVLQGCTQVRYCESAKAHTVVPLELADPIIQDSAQRVQQVKEALAWTELEGRAVGPQSCDLQKRAEASRKRSASLSMVVAGGACACWTAITSPSVKANTDLASAPQGRSPDSVMTTFWDS